MHHPFGIHNINTRTLNVSAWWYPGFCYKPSLLPRVTCDHLHKTMRHVDNLTLALVSFTFEDSHDVLYTCMDKISRYGTSLTDLEYQFLPHATNGQF